MSREDIAEINPDALFCDGFDEAIIGMAERINLGPVVAYDVEKIIEILMKDMEVDPDDLEDGRTEEDVKREMAYDYFYFNVQGAWMGEFTPIFITKKRRLLN
jgi:hypothetical protein